MRLFGRVWILGDDINTDLLAPGQYMRLPSAELAAHCLEAIRPDFAHNVQNGDMILAERGFGIGSSREQAAKRSLPSVFARLSQNHSVVFFNAMLLILGSCVSRAQLWRQAN